MANRRTHLVIIDPQNDFCDLPADYCPLDPVKSQQRLSPALPVAGAHADMLRVAQLIGAAGAALSQISVTLDSHLRLDIAHPTFWQQGDGAAVLPFTQISAAEVRSGKFVPRNQQALARVLAYLDALEAQQRYLHMVWPVHCEIGSWGNNVHAAVRAAYNQWEDATGRSVDKVVKGSNPWTEHYSAIQAEVPDSDDADTQLNQTFIDQLQRAERIYICGEAGSHCVKATTEHIVANFAAADIGKLVLIGDCISPVAGFEAQYRDFLADMQARGVSIASSAEVLAELQCQGAAK